MATHSPSSLSVQCVIRSGWRHLAKWLHLLGWLCGLWFLCTGPNAIARQRSSRPRHSERESGSSDRQAAQTERLRTQGLAALQAGQLPEATRLLTSAYASAPSPQGLYLLGRLALAEKRSLDAHDLMRRFLADPDLDREAESPPPAATPPKSPANPPAANPTPATNPTPAVNPTPTTNPTPDADAGGSSEIKEAERIVALPRPPAGTLNILGERGTLIYIDGRLVGALPLSLPLLLSPSEHKIVLERGQKRIEDQVQIAAGRLGELRSDVSSRALLLSILPGVLFVADFRDVSPELRARLQQSVEKALLARRLSPLTTDVALAALPPAAARKLGDCLQDLACQVELSSKVEVDTVLLVRSQGPADKLRLHVALVDGAVAQEAAAEELPCAGCNPDQAGAALLALVGRVYEAGSSRPRAELAVSCEPTTAELYIDSKVVAGCRYKRTVFAGEHRIAVQQPGYLSEQRVITLREGEKHELSLQLTQPEPAPAPLLPSPPPPKARQSRPTWRLAVGGVALVGGLLMVGFGSAMVKINGDCLREPEVAGGACERRYDTLAAGGGVLGGGLALAVAGGVLIGIPGPMK